MRTPLSLLSFGGSEEDEESGSNTRSKGGKPSLILALSTSRDQFVVSTSSKVVNMKE